MPRSKTITDDTILHHAIAMVIEHGVESCTFASLGAQVGMAPSTLVQRFGTKQRLLSLAAKLCFAEMSLSLAAAREESDSPLKALEEGMVAMVASIESARSYAHGLALFSISLTEPEAYQELRSGAERLQSELRNLLDAAIAAGELKPADTGPIATQLHIIHDGAIATWAMRQEGALTDWMRRQFTQFIQPYLASNT